MHDGAPHEVIATEHVKPGKGPAYVQAKLRRLRGGGIAEIRFNSASKVEQVAIQKEAYTYSYDAGHSFVFMHAESFDEFQVPRPVLEDRILFLKSGDEVEMEFVEGELLNVKLPKVVIHEITETPPALKGATATNQPKPASTETGLTIKVPPFIGIGERVRIDTDTGEYLERAKQL
jgi:elongation factor P